MVDRPIVLVVDDKPNMLRLLSKVLRSDARVITAESGGQALEMLAQGPVNVVVSDLKMPDMDGIEVLKACKELRPGAEFVLMTAYASVGTAVEALRLGAYDYLTKPLDPQEARAIVLRALGRSRALEGDSAGPVEVLPDMTARSSVMHELADLVKRVANSSSTTVIMGETGTGKERVARAIHLLSPRAAQRFVAINCAAMPADLIESELFGHIRGAFSGAVRDRGGLFEAAHQGTLFLDEIGDMRLSLQVKLTRALEEGAVRRIGDSRERPVDVRIIAATHRDLESMTRNETFREDLWYRLNVAILRVPPLRDRKEDIEVLAMDCLRDLAAGMPGREIAGFTPAALEALERYDWPGNVRQLRSAVERACLVAERSRIDIGDLPSELVSSGAGPNDANDHSQLRWAEALERGQKEVGKRYVEALMRRFRGQVSEAATHAGVERESFYRLMRRFGVDPARYR
ncbi:MAG: Fis family transcriptional regulator [Gemmatimonadetes bacterium]|nr:Fis family transcriptional regulator [Gemmatimonadota bacterium]